MLGGNLLTFLTLLDYFRTNRDSKINDVKKPDRETSPFQKSDSSSSHSISTCDPVFLQPEKRYESFIQIHEYEHAVFCIQYVRDAPTYQKNLSLARSSGTYE